MTTLRLDLAYHGAGFGGWAAQPGLRTVAGELTAALQAVLREPVSLTVAGRTDAGVHAWGQVASLETSAQPGRDLARALNGITADDLTVWSARPAPDGFDARRDARSRTYVYRILVAPFPSPFERGLSLWWPHRLDRGALDACGEALLGTHDFTAFTPTQTDHVRFERDIFRSEWRTRAARPLAPKPAAAGREAEEAAVHVLEFRIEADAFMRGMVRALVGTMLEVASGRRELDDFRRLLEGARREQAGDTAAAHGLYLASVRY